MARAMREFLAAAGVDLEHPELVGTPERVARAWCEEFLDGYGADPAELLAESFDRSPGPEIPAEPASELVLVKGIPFHGVCPHHLLPFQGLAHIGYVPGARLAPFSGLVRLLDGFAHRLEVQETITRQVVEALMSRLGARGAAAVLESEQTCMTLRGVKRRGSRILTSHFAGELSARPDLRSDFLRSIGRLE
jgi:GTP cyclohydrolase I